MENSSISLNNTTENDKVLSENNSDNNTDESIQKQAIANLINGIQIAQSRGAYTLDESSELLKSIHVFILNKST